MLTIDSEFVRVKARITLLHLPATIDDTINLLAELLSACSSSIEDLTAQCETALLIAVKLKSYEVFKVMLGWLCGVHKEEILQWKDGEGNTVLHIAMSTNQPKVMKLVIEKVNINAKNFSGLTALHIFHTNFTIHLGCDTIVFIWAGIGLFMPILSPSEEILNQNRFIVLYVINPSSPKRFQATSLQSKWR